MSDLLQGPHGKELVHPVIERLQQPRVQDAAPNNRLWLSDEEATRLSRILDQGFELPPALLESLRRLTDPARKPPELSWTEEAA